MKIELELSEAQAKLLWTELTAHLADEVTDLRALQGQAFIKGLSDHCEKADAVDGNAIERRNRILLATHFRSVCELLEILWQAIENPGKKASGVAAPRSERLLCKADEACEILGGISKVTLWRWVQTGRLKTIQGLGNTLYPIAELRRFASPVADFNVQTRRAVKSPMTDGANLSRMKRLD